MNESEPSWKREETVRKWARLRGYFVTREGSFDGVRYRLWGQRDLLVVLEGAELADIEDFLERN
jgi:hypothetical protein